MSEGTSFRRQFTSYISKFNYLRRNIRSQLSWFQIQEPLRSCKGGMMHVRIGCISMPILLNFTQQIIKTQTFFSSKKVN